MADRAVPNLPSRDFGATMEFYGSFGFVEDYQDDGWLILRRGAMRSQEEREEYLRFAPWKAEKEGEPQLTAERFAELSEREQFILTVCSNGYGKLSSAYEYRRIGRGGQGITNIDNLERNGPVVASFPAHNGEQLMLVTNQAKLTRMSVGDTRVIGRNSAGVRLFNVAENEHVVSAARIDEEEEPQNAAEALIARLHD